MQHAIQPARPAIVRAGIIERAFGALQVKLHEDANALCSTTMAADGVEAVTVTQENLPGFGSGAVSDAATNTGIPVTRLLQALDIVHHRGGSHRRQLPPLPRIQGE